MANKTGKKFGGRKKGTPNKKSTNLEQRAKDLGVDFDEMLVRAIAGDWKFFGFKEKSLMIGKAVIRDHIPFETRMEYLFEALPYVKPRLKQVDHTGSIGGNWLSGLIDEIDGTAEADESDDQD